MCWRAARKTRKCCLFPVRFHADLAAHQFHEPRADGQAESGPSVFARCRKVGLSKCVEEVRLLFRRDADSCVADLERMVAPSLFFVFSRARSTPPPCSVNLTAL